MGVPAGATMASTAAVGKPLALSESLSTLPLRSLATNHTVRAWASKAARKAGKSPRPWVATITQPPEGA